MRYLYPFVFVCTLLFSQVSWAEEASLKSGIEANEKSAIVATSARIALMQQLDEGGYVMYVLYFLAVVGLIFVVERFLHLRRKYISPPGLIEEADALWKAGKHDEIRSLVSASPSMLGRILDFIAEYRNSTYHELQEGCGDIARREFRKHNRRLYPLTVVGTLSPLLGLMGTVFGLLDTFMIIRLKEGGFDDPSELGASISKVLITTAAGLVIAIPALMFYHFFKSRTGDYLDELDAEVSATLNEWYLKK